MENDLCRKIENKNVFCGKTEKKPRERETNWSAAEKELLRECINDYIEIVEHKGNDASMITKKKSVWKTIRDTMASAGYDREIPKLKSQWVRMKVSARKAATAMKRASAATGNSVDIPEVSVEDNMVQSMIIHEFQEDDILIDSNSAENLEYLESDLHNSPKYIDKDSVIDLDESPSICIDDEAQEKKCNSPITITPLKDINNTKHKKIASINKIQRLRNLPKTPSKNNVLIERQRQIAKESLLSEDIHKLQKQQLVAEIEQKKRLHILELQRIQKQIEYDAELHNLKIQILKKLDPNQISNINI